MTQSDIADGRLVCPVGIAALQPAEFAIFSIWQLAAGSSRDWPESSIGIRLSSQGPKTRSSPR